MSKKYFTRCVCKNSNLSHLQRLGLDSLNIEPIQIRLITNDLVFMYKFLNDFINTNLSTCNQPSHYVNLRGKL